MCSLAVIHMHITPWSVWFSFRVFHKNVCMSEIIITIPKYWYTAVCTFKLFLNNLHAIESSTSSVSTMTNPYIHMYFMIVVDHAKIWDV